MDKVKWLLHHTAENPFLTDRDYEAHLRGGTFDPTSEWAKAQPLPFEKWSKPGSGVLPKDATRKNYDTYVAQFRKAHNQMAYKFVEGVDKGATCPIGMAQPKTMGDLAKLPNGARYCVQNTSDGSTVQMTKPSNQQLAFWKKEHAQMVAQANQNRLLAEDRYWDQHPVSKFFNHTLLNGLARVVDETLGFLPGVGPFIKPIYKAFAPPGSKYYQPNSSIGTRLGQIATGELTAAAFAGTTSALGFGHGGRKVPPAPEEDMYKTDVPDVVIGVDEDGNPIMGQPPLIPIHAPYDPSADVESETESVISSITSEGSLGVDALEGLEGDFTGWETGTPPPVDGSDSKEGYEDLDEWIAELREATAPVIPDLHPIEELNEAEGIAYEDEEEKEEDDDAPRGRRGAVDEDDEDDSDRKTGEGHFHPLKGKGIYSFIKKRIGQVYDRFTGLFKGTRRDFAPRIRQLLQSIGSIPIAKMAVRRDPLSSGLTGALNLISSGGLAKGQKLAGYDKLFHLCLELWIGQSRYVVERNETINIGKPAPRTRDTQYLPISMGGAKSNTLNAMLSQVRAVEGNEMFKYDAFRNNCQDFIMSLLRNNHQLNPVATQFIKQDLTQIVPHLPSWGEKFARLATDTAALADTVIHGQGAKGGIHTPLPPGGEGSISLKFHKQLDKAGVSPHRYLEEAQRKAKKARLKGEVEFSDDSKHKLQIVSPEGKTVRFGAVGLGDHIYYTLAHAENADQHRKSYLARATAIHGDWKKNKYSPNSLAIAVLW
jgi:hypothetical protein